jgi:predicted DNA-binding transcriptional regulator YafY
MRADRLISLLLTLQHSGRKTAQELAEELEVSERTIYRDVIALSTAGIPVYTERGPGGGIRLVESYRTTLTGLSPDEVQALFMFSVPAAMMDLGVSEQFQQAFLKLSASLSGTQQQVEQRVRQRVLIDSEGWGEQPGAGERISRLQQLYRAVWDDRMVTLTIKYHFGIQIDHLVEAYSLVARGNDWYLIGRVEGNFRVFGFFQIARVEVLETSFEREDDFDLNMFWQQAGEQFSSNFSVFPVEMWVSPQLLKLFDGRREYTELQRGGLGGTQTDWVLIGVEYKSFEDARRHVLNYGGAAQVVRPDSLRQAVQDYAEQILGIYREDTASAM